MNREILFRGKDLETGKWLYGSVIKTPNHTHISTSGEAFPAKVEPETVSQYTGLTDKNDTKIFEGDILQGDEYPYCSDGDYNYYAEVVWFDNGCCGFGLCTHKNPKSAVRDISDGNCEWFEDFDSNNWSVVGNIYDNPELIKE